jgi:hypothetical protein
MTNNGNGLAMMELENDYVIVDGNFWSYTSRILPTNPTEMRANSFHDCIFRFNIHLIIFSSMVRDVNPRKRSAPVRYGDMVNSDTLTDEDIDHQAEEAHTLRKQRVKRVKRAVESSPETVVKDKIIDEDDDDSSSPSSTRAIPIDELKVGDILSSTEYMRVNQVLPYDPRYNGRRRFNVTKLRSHKLPGGREDSWNITTDKPFQAASASRALKTVALPKTKLAEKLTSAGSSVFTVKYRTVLKEDELKKAVEAVKQSPNVSADIDRIITSMTTDREVITVGRLIKSDNVLGYSLVDDLQQKHASGETSEPVFRNINHRDILQLTLHGVQYDRKR